MLNRPLGVSRTKAAKLLNRWSGKGWLRRVGPSVYAPVGLDSLASEQVLDDPWVLVTEQTFLDIVVMTGRAVRAKSQRRHGFHFTLKHVWQGMIFGTKTVWRGRTQIAVSDIHSTILDMLDDPELGSGIQHVATALSRALTGVDLKVKPLRAPDRP